MVTIYSIKTMSVEQINKMICVVNYAKKYLPINY